MPVAIEIRRANGEVIREVRMPTAPCRHPSTAVVFVPTLTGPVYLEVCAECTEPLGIVPPHWLAPRARA